jgi:hypothetical protein
MQCQPAAAARACGGGGGGVWYSADAILEQSNTASIANMPVAASDMTCAAAGRRGAHTGLAGWHAVRNAAAERVTRLQQ